MASHCWDAIDLIDWGMRNWDRLMEMPTARTILLVLGIVCLVSAEQPVKLTLKADHRNITVGSDSELTVQLLDSQNRPAGAKKPMRIVLSARLQSGKVVELKTVDFAAGETTKRVMARMPAEGLLYVWAKNPELLPGGHYLNVKPGRAGALLPGQTMSAITAGRPQITLRYSPQRAFLADGRDAAMVEAFLIGDTETYPQDIRLNLYDSSHALRPTPLMI